MAPDSKLLTRIINIAATCSGIRFLSTFIVLFPASNHRNRVTYPQYKNELSSIRSSTAIAYFKCIWANVDLEQDPDLDAAIKHFVNFLQTNPGKEQVTKRVLKLKLLHKLNSESAACLVFSKLFPSNIYSQLKTSKLKLEVLKVFVSSPEGQKGVLRALEGSRKEELKLVPHILMFLYDAYLLEEEPVLKWYYSLKEGESSDIMQAAKVFIQWLA